MVCLNLGDLWGSCTAITQTPSNLNKLVMPIMQGACPKSSLLQVLLAWPSACGHPSLCSFGILNIGLEMPFCVLCSQNTVILAFDVDPIYFSSPIFDPNFPNLGNFN